uniref:Uncharacterized protein n=1 Tax=Molossus molossus TaxID=27622 RepID=A0A7J8DBW3_MOLMO|nr:hypothetical protein HJG59_009400 [Molossus molossus]
MRNCEAQGVSGGRGNEEMESSRKLSSAASGAQERGGAAPQVSFTVALLAYVPRGAGPAQCGVLLPAMPAPRPPGLLPEGGNFPGEGGPGSGGSQVLSSEDQGLCPPPADVRSHQQRRVNTFHTCGSSESSLGGAPARFKEGPLQVRGPLYLFVLLPSPPQPPWVPFCMTVTLTSSLLRPGSLPCTIQTPLPAHQGLSYKSVQNPRRWSRAERPRPPRTLPGAPFLPDECKAPGVPPLTL